MAETIRTEITNTTMTEKKQKEKGRKWDGRSRITTEQYKQNWNEIFNHTSTQHKRDRRDKTKDQRS